jgi:hypothetical protein
LAELVVIKPEHPFSGRELLSFGLCLGVAAWALPYVADFSLAYVAGSQYRDSDFARGVNELGRPALMVIGSAILGVCAPRRAWAFAPALAVVDVFLWFVRAGLAAGHSDLDRLDGLWPILLRILALTVLPAAVTGAIVYIVKD